jgi:cell division protein YceG involved in septum cleavage
MQNAITATIETRNDNRLYYVTRDGRTVKRYWKQLSDHERALQREAEARATYNDLFSIY